MTWDRVDDLFAKVAKNVGYRYRDVVEVDDVRQELWVWWLSHDQPDLSEPDWSQMRTLHTVAERYCKREHTARVGPGATYTTDEVFSLVELLVNPPSDETSDRLGGELSEVMTAVSNLPNDLRAPLTAHAAGESFRTIADRAGLSVSTAHRRVQQALTAIVIALNGEA